MTIAIELATVDSRVGRRAAGRRRGEEATNLFVFETQQQDLLHQGELGLLAPLCILTDVAGVEGDLVAVFAALVAGLRGAVLEVAGGIGAVDGAAVAGLCIACGCCSSAGASSPSQSRRGGHDCLSTENPERVAFQAAWSCRGWDRWSWRRVYRGLL